MTDSVKNGQKNLQTTVTTLYVQCEKRSCMMDPCDLLFTAMIHENNFLQLGVSR